MEKILLIIFWLIIGLYAFQLAFRYIVPWFVARFIRKMAERMQNNSTQSYGDQAGKEKDIRIKFNKKQEPVIDPEVGEYIDFEEIKENEDTNRNE